MRFKPAVSIELVELDYRSNVNMANMQIQVLKINKNGTLV